MQPHWFDDATPEELADLPDIGTMPVVEVMASGESSPDWWFRATLFLMMRWRDGLVMTGGLALFLVLAGYTAGRMMAG